MSKKLYAVKTYKIDFSEDTSRMKKDYSVFLNAYLTGMHNFATLVVYEENGKYKELLSGIEIPVMEERIYLLSCDNIPEYPNAQLVEYHYSLKGNYPIFFFINKIDEADETVFNHELEEVSEDYLEKYKAFIKNQYSDDQGNFINNWSHKLEEEFIENLFVYGEILDKNGYSDEYITEYLDESGTVKKYKKLT